MGRHHRATPEEKPIWPAVDRDEPVQRASRVRPYVQDLLPTVVMGSSVVRDDAPTVPTAVRLAGLKAIEEFRSDTSEPGEDRS